MYKILRAGTSSCLASCHTIAVYKLAWGESINIDKQSSDGTIRFGGDTKKHQSSRIRNSRAAQGKARRAGFCILKEGDILRKRRE